ncbi:hypothetical protein M885DRAFT_573641 [Pelagophyceae sp. CCMP2097]|nr:hypothetical protein M885DRAFT_573641 [Pelagophyceae sp. CCMP2097]
MDKGVAVDRSVGPNSLRGGRKLYSPCTLLSNWVTTTMEQQATGCALPFPAPPHAPRSFSGRPVIAQTFGAGVFHAGASQLSVIGPDKTARSATWESVAHESSEFVCGRATSFKLRGGLQGEALRAYRENWTKDTKSGADLRFGKWAK